MIKAIIVVISLIGLFFGLFSNIDLWPHHDTEQAQLTDQHPEITNEWAALAASDDAAYDNVLQAVKEHQLTARQTNDNATRVALYQEQQHVISKRIQHGYTTLIWFLVSVVAVSLPVPRRRCREMEQ